MQYRCMILGFRHLWLPPPQRHTKSLFNPTTTNFHISICCMGQSSSKGVMPTPPPVQQRMLGTWGQSTCSVIADLIQQHFEKAKSDLANLTSSTEDLPDFWHLAHLFCRPDRVSFRVLLGSYTCAALLLAEQIEVQAAFVRELTEIGHSESKAKELKDALVNLLDFHLDLLMVERCLNLNNNSVVIQNDGAGFFQNEMRASIQSEILADIPRFTAELKELSRQCKNP